MKRMGAIISLVLVMVIILVFVIIFNKKLIIERAPIIVLNEEEFQKGDNLTAEITTPYNIFLIGCGLASPYKLNFLNENKEWMQIINPENAECSPYCRNDVISTDESCRQKWTLGQCVNVCRELNQVGEYFIRLYWNMNLYEYKNESCGNEKGIFKFAKPASPGQYKVQYNFFDDKSCRFQNSIEKIFVIK